MVLAMITTLAIGLFSGAALYINLAEHPARMACGVTVATTVFGPSYRRAARMQASLAATALITGVGAWLQEGEVVWLIAGMILGSVIPFTLFAIAPTNKKLLAADLDANPEGTEELLIRWGRLHAVRTVVGLVAFVVVMWHLAG